MDLRTAIATYDQAISVYLSEESLKTYRSRLRFLTQQINPETRLDEITRSNIDRVVVAYREKRAANTTRLFVVVIRELFKFCVEEGYLDRSPAARLRKPRMGRRAPRSLSEQAADKLLVTIDKPTTSWPDRRNVVLVYFFSFTGLRRAEALSLRWKDVDLLNQTLIVRGKGDRERTIPIHTRLLPLLRRIQRPGAEYVFSREDGGKLNPNSLNVLLKKWLCKHGIENVSPHVLRHTFASRLVARGASLDEIRDLLGHDSVRTTEIYISQSAERLRGAVDKL